MILSANGEFTFSVLQKHITILNHFSSRDSFLVDVLEAKKKVVRQIRKEECFAKGHFFNLVCLILGLANEYRIDVQTSITVAYPDFCIYCGGKPCHCGQAKRSRPVKRLDIEIPPNMEITVSGFQRRDWEVYPNGRTLKEKKERAIHLSEEVDELLINLLRRAPVKEIEEEISDVIERLISLSSTFRWSFGRGIAMFLRDYKPA